MRSSFYFITLLAVLSSFSQERTLIGRLLDEETGDPVRYAVISNPRTDEMVSTNYSGYFQMEVEEADSLLSCSHIAYGNLFIPIPEVNQFLLKIPPSLREIVITKIPQVNDGVKGDAHFPGGSLDLYNYIVDNLYYSREAARMGIEGLSKVRFTVNEDGSLSDIRPTKTIGAGVEEEMVRMLRNSTKWIAATQQGKPVKQRVELGVEFIFSDGNGLFPPKISTSTILPKIEFEEVPDEEIEEIFSIVEQPASYPGGVTKFYDYLSHNLIYPADAKKMKIEGRVFVQFIVERDGSLTEVKVVRGVHPSLDEEAVRVLKNSDNWIPGTQNGNPVRQKIIQNITFKLPGSNGNSTTAPPLEIGTKLRVPVHKEANPHKGVQGLKKYLKENKRELNTPLPPNENLNQVKLSFVIDTVGEIGDIEVIKSLGEERDQEAIRLFMEMPSWKPAEINDSPVAKRYEYSVDFNTIPEKDITAAIRLYRSAIENYSKGRKDSALDLLNKAIDKNPTALNFYFDRAAILIKMEDNLAACKDLEYIKDYDPQALSIYQQLCGKKE